MSAGTPALGGFGSACISISYSFQSRNPVQIYNTGRNLSRPLAKWLHQRASLVETEQVCQNNTAWKTPRTPEERENVTMAQRTPFFFSLAANFPRQITLVRRPKDRAHRITKRGGGGEGHQIVEFPIRSLAEIWNNNPHQGLATSVRYSIHWTMARNRASHGVRRNQPGNLSHLMFSTVTLTFYPHHRMECSC